MTPSEQILSLLARRLPNLEDYKIEPFYEKDNYSNSAVIYVVPYSIKPNKIENILKHTGWETVYDTTPHGAIFNGSLHAEHQGVVLTLSIVGIGGPTVLSAQGSTLISEFVDSSVVLNIVVKGWTLSKSPTLAEVLGHPLLNNSEEMIVNKNDLNAYLEQAFKLLEEEPDN